MYDWLAEALLDDAQLVTANRRLSRVLAKGFAQQQVAAGHSAWVTPQIFAWDDWIRRLIDTAAGRQDLPLRLTRQQSAVLWEHCLRREAGDPDVGVSGLVRLAMEAWDRLHAWRLPLDDCRRFAHSADQRVFAGAAHRYSALLEAQRWVDNSLLAGVAIDLLRDGSIVAPSRITLAGFDRVSPFAQQLLDALGAAGTDVVFAHVATGARPGSIHAFENADAELREAGRWARRRLTEDPNRSIAIVASGLEQAAERSRRLVLEGLAPGWQYGGSRCEAALNVSYGRKLSAFPAIAIAQLALRWVAAELTSTEVSLLLRSPLIGRGPATGRARLELELRQLPAHDWSPTLLLRALRRKDYGEDADDWLNRIGVLAERRRELPKRGPPSMWAEWIDATLRELNWPGEGALTSDDFQLVNRWRELLNDLARLELVSQSLSFAQACSRLGVLAGETVFQPEATDAVVQLLGPLETAGMQFDEVWLSGLSARDWPPPGRPSPLLPRRLQREYGMPDADPVDTADYSRRVLRRLCDSADVVHCSFPVADGDEEQTATALLGPLEHVSVDDDPGWHVDALRARGKVVAAPSDAIPQVDTDEIVSGGASTVQDQLSNPFAAFARGRLGIGYLPMFATGLAANMRGNLVHDALQRLYEECPDRDRIREWGAGERDERVSAAVAGALARHERHADSVLHRLLAIERGRVERLLRGVIAVDADRAAFRIDSVEGGVETELHGVRLRLRFDRIDRLDDEDLVILDYKTGTRKKFLDGDGVPRDFQLVVYACTLPRDVAGLALMNIDSREIAMDGAGPPFNDGEEWHRRLGGWKAEVRSAIDIIRRGDVRVNAHQGIREARRFALLTRIAELRRDH